MQYNTHVEITLKPVRRPTVVVQVGDQLVHAQLVHTNTYKFEITQATGPLIIAVEMREKSDTDSTTAVIIENISLGGISDPKFIWTGIYRPEYPELWASTQTDLKETIEATNYLGWNGRWELQTTVPIFTWIHQIRGLGWIFE